jgi:hypothetical protein
VKESEFLSEVGQMIGSTACLAMRSGLDQQGARNALITETLRPVLGDDMVSTLDEMLDTAYVAGFVNGLRLDKGESDEG